MGFWWWSGKPDPNSSKVFLNVRIQNARPRARSVKEQLVTPLSLSPLPSSVRYRSCRSIPSLLNTWELHAPGHQQCLSIPSPKGFLHRGKDRDELDGMVMAWDIMQIPSHISLYTGTPLMTWATRSGAQFILAPSHRNVLQRCGASTRGLCCHRLCWISQYHTAPHFSKKENRFRRHRIIWASQLSTRTIAVRLVGKICDAWTQRFGEK